MPIFIPASVLCPQANKEQTSRPRRTGILLNPSFATPPALVAVGTTAMFRVVTEVDIDGKRQVHAEPLVRAARNSSWQYGGNRLHSGDPAFIDFTGASDSIPLFDVQAA